MGSTTSLRSPNDDMQLTRHGSATQYSLQLDFERGIASLDPLTVPHFRGSKTTMTPSKTMQERGLIERAKALFVVFSW